MKRRTLLGATLSAAIAVAAIAPTEEMNKVLQESIRSGDNARIKAALDGGADPNAKDADGTPMLMNAALHGSAATIKMLLDKGADPNARNTMEATALIWGAADPAKVRLLVARGADVNATSKLGRTPLLAAAGASRNVSSVKLLLDKGAKVEVHDSIAPIPVVPVGGGKGTPLIEAARSGDFESVRLLVEAGADVKAITGHSVTALSEAVAAGRTDVVRYLLEQGSPVDSLVTARKFNLMALAEARGNQEVIAMLRAKGAPANTEWKFFQPQAPPMTASNPMPADVSLSEALTRAVNTMRKAAPESYKKTGCASCHHQALPAVAATAASKVVPLGDLEPEQQMVRMSLSMLKPMTPVLLEGSDVPPDMQVTGAYFLEAMKAREYGPDLLTAAIVHKVAQSQLADGHWTGWAPRPPLEFGDIQATAMAIRSMTLYPMAGRQAEMEERIARARKWLINAAPKSTEDYTMRMLGLQWSNAPRAIVLKAARELAGLQRGNGGWAQESWLEPDAYATGKALVALSQAGVRMGNTVAAVRFLRQTQQADGTWMVQTRAVAFQPLVDTGFPHGRNQWISDAATAWAVHALVIHAN